MYREKQITYKDKKFNGSKIYSYILFNSLTSLREYETYDIELKLSNVINVVNNTTDEIVNVFNLHNNAKTIRMIRNILLENFVSSFMFIIHEYRHSEHYDVNSNNFNASFITLYKDLNMYISESPDRTSLGKILHEEYLSKIFPDIDNIKLELSTLLEHFNLSHKHLLTGYIKERVFNRKNNVMRLTVSIVFLV